MISESIIGVLRILSERLGSQNLSWVLVGSVSLALHEVNVTPGDIDILTDKSSAYRINQLLKDCEVKSVEYQRSDTVQSHLGEFVINDVKVEVMGDYQEKMKGKWQDFNSRLTSPVIVQFEGMQLPLSSLADQLYSYEALGRKRDKAKITTIREVLKSRREAEEPRKQA